MSLLMTVLVATVSMLIIASIVLAIIESISKHLSIRSQGISIRGTVIDVQTKQDWKDEERWEHDRWSGEENNMNDTLQAAPQTLIEAIKELPRQYTKIFIKPSVEKFSQEMGKARWSMVWAQLFLYLGTTLVFALLVNLQPALRESFGPNTILGLNMPLNVTLSSLLEFIFTMGTLYILARMFKGQGSILTQTYILLMLSVPLQLLNLVGLAFYLIPFAGVALFYVWIIGWSIYAIVLLIYALMAVHRLSRGKATGVFFIDLLLIVVGPSVLSIITTHLH